MSTSRFDARLRKLEPKRADEPAAWVWLERGQTHEDALKVTFGDAAPPPNVTFVGWLPDEERGGYRLDIPGPWIDKTLKDLARAGRPRPGRHETISAVTGVERSEGFGKW